MSERVDHAAEAKFCLERATPHFTPDDATLMVANAQVHATLALVEQQCIANLIALGMYTNADGSRLAQNAVAAPNSEHSVALNDDIREGLGLPV